MLPDVPGLLPPRLEKKAPAPTDLRRANGVVGTDWEMSDGSSSSMADSSNELESAVEILLRRSRLAKNGVDDCIGAGPPPLRPSVVMDMRLGGAEDGFVLECGAFGVAGVPPFTLLDRLNSAPNVLWVMLPRRPPPELFELSLDIVIDVVAF